jgi:hypothetical protein
VRLEAERQQIIKRQEQATREQHKQQLLIVQQAKYQEAQYQETQIEKKGREDEKAAREAHIRRVVEELPRMPVQPTKVVLQRAHNHYRTSEDMAGWAEAAVGEPPVQSGMHRFARFESSEESTLAAAKKDLRKEVESLKQEATLIRKQNAEAAQRLPSRPSLQHRSPPPTMPQHRPVLILGDCTEDMWHISSINKYDGKFSTASAQEDEEEDKQRRRSLSDSAKSLRLLSEARSALEVVLGGGGDSWEENRNRLPPSSVTPLGLMRGSEEHGGAARREDHQESAELVSASKFVPYF